MVVEIGSIIAAVVIVIGIIIYIIKKPNVETVETPAPNVPDVVPGEPGSRLPTKKALIVGINKYLPELDADLMGCVNDAENMRDILVNIYKFNPDNVRLLLDDRATKPAIVERLNWLINGCIPGDELVFHYSGHGSQVRDRSGDELSDELDEILCPHDMNWDDPLTDDYIGEIFAKVPAGVNLTMICDACHSGTMTREIVGNSMKRRARFILPPYDIRSRSIGRDLSKHRLARVMEGPQNHVLLSGCRDDQTSSDAFIDGKYQGALTWAFSEVVRNNPNFTWKDAHAQVLNKISPVSDQIPQLSGDDNLVDRKMFGGD